MSPDVSLTTVLTELHRELERLYGDRLVVAVLFGSHATGQAGPGSDVDVLVVLTEPLETYVEIKRLVPIAMDLWLRHGIDVQLTPFSAERYADPQHPLMMNVHREGVELSDLLAETCAPSSSTS
jgi:uncharacterized protein